MPRPSLRQQGVPVELVVPLEELVDEVVVEDVPQPNLVLRDFLGLVEGNRLFCVFFLFVLMELRFGFASCKAKRPRKVSRQRENNLLGSVT